MGGCGVREKWHIPDHHPSPSSLTDTDGINALHMSAIVGNAEAARLLLENGAEVDQGEARGLASLHLAALYGHDGFVRLLVSEYSASINLTSKSGNTALSCASLKVLLSRYNAPDSNGNLASVSATPFLIPNQQRKPQGNLASVDALVSLGALVTATNSKGLSPLDLARSQGHGLIVDALLAMSRAVLSSNFEAVAVS